jgi:hypothetical protein
VQLRSESAGQLLLNLFRHIIPSVAAWFKVLKYSSDPDTVMQMLADMTAAASMVGCTNYVLALAQFIAQLQELRRKAPSLWSVVMRNFHAFNGLFIEDQHADLTRLLQGAHRVLTGKVLNDELRVLEHRAAGKEFLENLTTEGDRKTWSLPTVEDVRYAHVIEHCKLLLGRAVAVACHDGTESELEPAIRKRLAYGDATVRRLVGKVAEQDVETFSAAREESVSEFPGDKMVCF